MVAGARLRQGVARLGQGLDGGGAEVGPDVSGDQMERGMGNWAYLLTHPSVWYPIAYVVPHLLSDNLSNIWYPSPFLAPHSQSATHSR